MKTENKIKSEPEIVKLAENVRNKKKTIVFLNGSFDMLHPGHVYIIEEAKKQGDILIVALNSDNSIKRNKGKDRPINDEQFRLRMIAALANVDYVTLFDEDNPIKLLEKIKPNIFVNGSEYGENCIEAPTIKKIGGKVHIVTRIPEYSTSNLIANVKKNK